VPKKSYEFQVGDIVELKSGGPDMSVKRDMLDGNYECQWFAGKKLCEGYFEGGTLKLADPKSQKKS
jgi:uncharacterized protein YodC (DUF2158 family)